MLLVEIHLAPSLSFALHLSDQHWIMEVSTACFHALISLLKKQLILRWAELWQKPSQYTSLLRLASLQIYNLVCDLELDHTLGPCAERWEIRHFLRKSLYCSKQYPAQITPQVKAWVQTPMRGVYRITVLGGLLHRAKDKDKAKIS